MYNIGIVDVGHHCLQHQLQLEGHKLKTFVEIAPELGNLTPKQFALTPLYKNQTPVSSWEQLLASNCDAYLIGAWADYTSSPMYEQAQVLGVPALGYSCAAMQMECDRNFAKKVSTRIDHLKIVESVSFTDRQKALAFAKKTKRKWVLKQHQSSPLHNSTLRTVVCKTSRISVPLLEQGSSAWFEENKGGVIFEQYIEGQEVSFGGWFDGKQFVHSFYAYIEHKGAQNGERGGIMTGEVGTCMAWRELDYTKKACKMLASLAKVLDGRCVGMVDINTILTHNGDLYLIEYTMRFGVPTLQMAIASQQKPLLGTLMCGLATKNEDIVRNAKQLYDTKGFYTGVAVYSYGHPIAGIDLSGVFFDMPKAAKTIAATYDHGKNKWNAKTNERQYIVVGGGASPDESVQQAYSSIGDIPFGCTYRDDIGATFDKTWTQLVKQGIVPK